MSERNDRGMRDFSQYDSMTTEELSEILRLDAHKPDDEESDFESLFYVMEVLASRKRSEGGMKSPEEAFESFKKNYLPSPDEDEDDDPSNLRVVPKKVRTFRWKRALTAVAAAIAIVFLGTVTTNAFGYDIWGTLFGWTAETFFFVDTVSTEGAGNTLQSDEVTFDSLQDALDYFGITYNLVPTWFPEGYELEEITVGQTSKRVSILATYKNGEEIIMLSVTSYVKGNPERIEAETGKVELYTAKGVNYYILSDIDQIKAAWTAGEFECYISGNVTVDDMKEMIISIGG